MFFQEVNEKLKSAIDPKIFKLIEPPSLGDSIIIIRKERFKKIHDHKKVLANIDPKTVESLLWNKDTAIAFVDNLILFSGHLSSKKEKNEEQVKNMLNSLTLIRQIYPNEHIIVGCDTNAFIPKIP